MVEGKKDFTLLLVDDNPTNLSLLAQIVEMDLPQVQVLTARSAEGGLLLAAEHEIDGAFVDVQMPGMSGLELCRRFSEDLRFSQIPVVLMTAHIATAELRADGLNAGAYDFISQPISNVEMLARIKVMLRLRQSEKQLLDNNQQLREQVASKTSALRWLGGLLLAGGDDVAEEDRELAAKLEARLPQDSRFTIEHFTGELFQEMPLRWRRTVLKLVLLDEVPLELAERLTEITDIEGALDYLWRHNFFIDQTGENTGCYLFQRDLRDRLRLQAETNLTGQEQGEVHLLAADWYRQHGQELTALGYLLNAGFYSEAELLLSQQGTALMAGKSLSRLTALMDKTPEQMAVKRGWIALYVGIGKLQCQPKDAADWLELARTLFFMQGERRGELLALAHQFQQSLLVDGLFNLGKEVKPRLKELLEQHAEALDPVSQALGLGALGFIESFYGNDLKQAEDHVREGLQHAVRSEIDEIQFLLRQFCTYLALQRGRFSLAFAEQEISQTLGRELPESAAARLMQKVLMADLLLATGNFFNSREHFLLVEQVLGKGFLQQTFIGPVICRFRVEALLASGEKTEARDLLEICMTRGMPGDNAHTRSMLLQLRALLWSGETGREESVLSDLQESVCLREKAGGVRYVLINWIIAAACFTEQKDFSRAEEILSRALQLSTDQGELLLRGGIYARQADLLLCRGQEQEALTPLGQLLTLLDQHKFDSFYLVTPDLLQRLLPLAVRHQVLPDLARKMAVRHLRGHIHEDGSLLPLLEIITLGPSGINREGKRILERNELGSVARQIVDLLVVAPGHKLGLECMLDLLWPEKSTKLARASFDTNLSRLRKTLDAGLGSGTSRDYLVLVKGVLSLQNAIVDCQMFVDATNRAQQHLRRQEVWQAGLLFRQADRLWNGEFLVGHDLIDELVKEQQTLTEMRLDMIEAWCDLLLQDNSGEEVELLLQEGVRLDPTREQLVSKSYNYYLGRNEPLQARKVLDSYRQALLADEYPVEDVMEIVMTLEREGKTILEKKGKQ